MDKIDAESINIFFFSSKVISAGEAMTRKIRKSVPGRGDLIPQHKCQEVVIQR
jgi:hypothetical protein